MTFANPPVVTSRRHPGSPEDRLTGKSQAGSSRRSSEGSRVFLAGFGLSLLILMLEYLTAGSFPGWFILVPSNPTTLLAALVGHRIEAAVGARWSDEAFFATLAAESAGWWYGVGAIVGAVRRRRAHGPDET